MSVGGDRRRGGHEVVGGKSGLLNHLATKMSIVSRLSIIDYQSIRELGSSFKITGR